MLLCGKLMTEKRKDRFELANFGANRSGEANLD
jgi:hypothetical protein